MQRDELATWWDEAWKTGLWCAAWSRALEGLTAEQAAWRPAPGRHSIGQIVQHMIFWREDAVRRAAGGQRPSDAEIEQLNFPEPADVSETAWRATRERFGASQQAVRQALASPATPLDRLKYLLPHDQYHVGQIMYVRALQGLAVIE